MDFDKSIHRIIEKDFVKEERDFVIQELNSITPEHVMAQSETNLYNTRVSILKLSKGNRNQVREYAKCARVDFRDVIYWADLES